MIFNVIHIVLAAFGLGFLIFIHELGHYWMAKRAGMTVEVFSIGLGKAFYSWEHKGVKWQLCYLPFGGYVRIAGMEKKGYLEPYDIPDGFYGKKPWSRIKVAAIGPLVNLCFAFILFCILWISGGRNKPFSEYTRLIGWVDPCSGMYDAGVREGDEITELNHRPFYSFHDVLYAAMLDDKNPAISGLKMDYFSGEKLPLQYAFPIEATAKGVDRVHAVTSAFSPAEYLLYTDEGSLPAGSPMKNSGIAPGDRLVWADGKVIFSKKDLIATINEPKALLTVEREAKTFLVRVPRVKISDLRVTAEQKSEMEDWQHEGNIKGKVQDLFFIPYSLNDMAVVDNSLTYLNAQSLEEQPCAEPRTETEVLIKPYDRIVAVDGIPVHSSIELFHYLQTRHIQIIVRNADDMRPISWKSADQAFVCDIDWHALRTIVCSIGTNQIIQQMGALRLLNPVEPKTINEFPLPDAMRARISDDFHAQKQAIGDMQDAEERTHALLSLEKNQHKILLGIQLQDRSVSYNPSPVLLFTHVFKETWRTLIALVTGMLSPKWLAGPVGMVQVMHHSWSVGAKEAIYWLAVISLNLGLLNFLPIPVLDGGHICFSLWEIITKKRLKAKTMERFIIPFILLLIALFIYLTYHDIMRLIGLA